MSSFLEPLMDCANEGNSTCSSSCCGSNSIGSGTSCPEINGKRNRDDQNEAESAPKRIKAEEFIEAPSVVLKTKLCSGCKQEKNVNLFSRHKSRNDGLQGICKSCHRIAKRQSRVTAATNGTNETTEPTVAQPAPTPETITKVYKWCIACEQNLEIDLFYKKKGNKDGHRVKCISCYRKRIVAQPDPTPETTTKVYKCCVECKQTLEIDLFHKKKANKDGHSVTCISCYRQSSAGQNKKAQCLFDDAKKKAHCDSLRNQAGCCNQCGSTENIQNLQFAHYSRKDKRRTKNGTRRAFVSCTIQQMNKELQFGRFICLKCHCIETEAENKAKLSTSPGAIIARNSRKKRYDFVNNRKMEIGSCQQSGCGKIVCEPFSYWQFDHLPQYVKVAAISELVATRQSLEMIAEEMKKCQLLCADCHQITTVARRAEKKLLTNDAIEIL